VTLRVVAEVGWLRRMDAYRAVRRALTRVLANHDAFRIVHISVQGTHVHVLCEADDKVALARGIQGFQIAAAKALNRLASKRAVEPRTGQVFADRYHVESISSVRQTRHALAYVLNNWRRHHEDGGSRGAVRRPGRSVLERRGLRRLARRDRDVARGPMTTSHQR